MIYLEDIKINYNDIIREKKVISHCKVEVDSMFGYESALKTVAEYFVKHDLKKVVPEGIKYTYTESALEFNKRFMLCRTQTDMFEFPSLYINASVLTENPFDEELFPNDIFKMELAESDLHNSLDPSKFADVIISYDNKKDFRNELYFGVTPDVAYMTIEMSILIDSDQRADNMLIAWNKIRRDTSPFELEGVLQFIVPSDTIIILAHSLGYFKDKPKNTNNLNLYEMYLYLKKYISTESPYTFKYVRDNSRGRYEVVLQYFGTVYIKPAIINKSINKSEEMQTEILVTRSFDFMFNIPSIMYLRAPYEVSDNIDYINILARPEPDLKREIDNYNIVLTNNLNTLIEPEHDSETLYKSRYIKICSFIYKLTEEDDFNNIILNFKDMLDDKSNVFYSVCKKNRVVSNNFKSTINGFEIQLEDDLTYHVNPNGLSLGDSLDVSFYIDNINYQDFITKINIESDD